MLEFIWISNISGVLGTGTSLTVGLPDPGTHIITLTVSDGEFEKSVTLTLIIEPMGIIEPSDAPSEAGLDIRIPERLL